MPDSSPRVAAMFKWPALFAVTVIILVVIATTVSRRLEKRKAIAAIVSLGGEFSNNYDSLNLQDTACRDVHLRLVSRLWNLTFLNLGATKITDTGINHLRRLKKLESLYLRDTSITDAGLVHLEGLRNLVWLELEGSQVSDAGLQELQTTLPNLSIQVGLKSELPPDKLSEDGFFIGTVTEDSAGTIVRDTIIAEEYTVLSDLLYTFFADTLPHNEVLLIAAESMSATDVFRTSTSRWSFAHSRSNSLSRLRRETFVSWERNNSRRFKWGDLLNPKLRHHLYPVLQGSFFWPAPESEYHDRLHSRDAMRVIVSRVGFGKGGSQALVYIEFPHVGEFVLAEKSRGKWKVVSTNRISGV